MQPREQQVPSSVKGHGAEARQVLCGHPDVQERSIEKIAQMNLPRCTRPPLARRISTDLKSSRKAYAAKCIPEMSSPEARDREKEPPSPEIQLHA
ncbi:Glutamate receptor ionotropic, NMDA 3B [Manis javanica]|nr:Glutamate receptor ionotropic, NMDA 3B [Manis javanica]